MCKPTTKYIFLIAAVAFMFYVIRATMLATPIAPQPDQPNVLQPQPPVPLSGSKAYTININTIADTRDEWKTNKARFISLVKPYCQNVDKFYAEADSDTTTFSLAVQMCGFKEAVKICNTIQSE